MMQGQVVRAAATQIDFLCTVTLLTPVEKSNSVPSPAENA